MDDAAPAGPRSAPLTRAELRTLWWAAPPLVVLVLASLLFDLTGGGYGRIAAEVAATSAPPGPMAHRAAAAAAALGWASLTLLYLCVMAGTIVGTSRILCARVRGGARRPFVVFLIGTAGLGLANLAVVEVTDAPLRAIFDVTRDALFATSAIDATRASLAVALVAAINVLSPVIVALLLAAAAAAALPPAGGWTEATLTRCAASLRRIVTIAAAFMVAGVLHMGAWTAWAVALLSGASNGPLHEVAVPVTLFWGVSFTLMIASFYLPVAARLGELAESIMDAAGIPLVDRQKWLAARGLSFRLGEQLPQIAAMLAPLLAGPLSATLGKLAGAVTL